MATLPQMKSFLTRASKKSDASEGLKRIANALKNFRQLDKGDQKDLNDLVRSAYAKLKSKPKATSTPKKATPKKTDSFATDLDKFKKKVGKVIFRRATSGTDIVKDAKRPALKSGKRIVRKQGYTSNQYGTFENKVGTPYWESRSNRMDVNQPSQRARVKLADGGEVGKSYTYGNEGYSYTNNFGVDQADFIKLVDVYHNTNPLDQMDRIVERLTYREFANKYGEEKLHKVMNYIHQTHKIHEGRYAKGGKLSSRAKYIPNRNIEEVEVNQNGKTKFIDGADILDGFYLKKKR